MWAMPTDREALGRFFDIKNGRFDRCLEPTMVCEQRAIRAHSIQNRHTLELLQAAGHVVALRPRATGDQPPTIDFELIGRNNASTFAGFCGEHDRFIFAPIDTKPLDIGDREQLFLFAYRAVTFELHAIMESAAKIQSMYQARVDLGWDPADKTSPAAQFATSNLLYSWITWRYRADKFDEDFLSRQFDNLDHDVIFMDTSRPSIAVSSLFTVEGVTHDDDTVRIALNVLPLTCDRTVALFSYHKTDSSLGRAALGRILTAQGEYQKYELSKLIVRKMSNFYVSPDHYATWGLEKRNRIREEFTITALREHARNIGNPIGHASDIEHADFMLF